MGIEQDRRESGDRQIVDNLREEVLMKHPQEAMGAGWISVGIALATAPQELLKLFSSISG
jgi:hypothetical protein